MERRINLAIKQTLKKLGYHRWELKDDNIHAHRGNDHLIITLTKNGKMKKVAAHKDRTIMIGAIGIHKAKSSQQLRKEFVDGYHRVIYDVRTSVEKLP